MSPSNNRTRQRIIEAMYHLIAEYGYDKASMSKLCAIIGIKKPSIYYHFKSKEDILLAVYDDIHIPIDSNDEICKSKNPAEYRELIISLGTKSIAGFHDDAERHRVLAEIDLQSTRISALAKHQISVAQKTSQSYKDILQCGVDLGVLPSNFDTEIASQFIYTLMAGMSQTVAKKDYIDEEAVWNWFVNNLIIGSKKADIL